VKFKDLVIKIRGGRCFSISLSRYLQKFTYSISQDEIIEKNTMNGWFSMESDLNILKVNMEYMVDFETTEE
jgi:hypothetical protein